jgi:dihydrofolate reductase
MGQIIFDGAATINGFLADEHDSLDWLFAVDGPEPDPALLPTGVTVHVEGATTYLWVLRYEGLMENPAKWQELFGDRPTFVFTHRDLPIPDGADVRLVRGPVAEHLEAIRAAAADGNIWLVGGGELVGQFLDAGALDVLAVTVAPATLAGGAPLLPRNLGPDRLRLREAGRSGPFARLVYDVLPVREPGAQASAASPDSRKASA